MNLNGVLDAATARLRAAGVDFPRKEARLLLASAADMPQEKIVSGQLELNDQVLTRFEGALMRRERHEPFAYIVGKREFWSMALTVGQGVLIPRPESEILVEQSLYEFPNPDDAIRVLDCGTGSGCLLLALLKERPNASGVGIERSPEALHWATHNAHRFNLDARVELIEADWSAAPLGPFDLILANPPYVSTHDMEALAPELHSEPMGALDGGADGLAAYRTLAPIIRTRLSKQGRALVEIGAGQRSSVEGIFADAGLSSLKVVKDLAGIERCLVVA